MFPAVLAFAVSGRTFNHTLNACDFFDTCSNFTTPSTCHGNHSSPTSNVTCSWVLLDGEHRCMNMPGSCCYPMGDNCLSPDVDRWPCCCPGKSLLPGGCVTPCSNDTCGCTGSQEDSGKVVSCCKANEPCQSDGDCCRMGASGAGLCGADNLCIAHVVQTSPFV